MGATLFRDAPWRKVVSAEASETNFRWELALECRHVAVRQIRRQYVALGSVTLPAPTKVRCQDCRRSRGW